MKEMKNDGGIWIHKREGYKGELFMGINPTNIPEIIIFVYNLLFADWVYERPIIKIV
jgi:hypothetical protein